MEKIRVGLFFGSISSEHEVSCTSAAAWLRALDPAKYEVIRVGITKQGRWLRYDGPVQGMEDGVWAQDAGCRPCVMSPDREDHGLLIREDDGKTTVQRLDVAVPMLHGRNGEDGRIQGIFEMAGVPFVGCGVLSSAVCMDKEVACTLMDANGIPHCAWDWCDRDDAADFPALADRLEAKLGYPIFVKPANAGSSVGITKAHDREELRQAVLVALQEDNKVLFEQFISGQEVECAAIGNAAADSFVTRPGEILAGAEFYTYDDKYKNGVSQVVIPARLPEAKLDEVREIALKAYRVLGCTGLARCDFFVEHGTGRVLCNELNTMPGFTSISMYPKLMAHDGLSFSALADRLISLALSKRKGAY
jgi:D-alanine-D-alanine ligase